ncbi:MAG TPA: signal peptidase II [Candidatus Latescibacteria bacterium]|nr:signal peptidase II [Candidatus Latescibacterota bacterium]
MSNFEPEKTGRITVPLAVVIVLLADQVSKFLVKRSMALGDSVRVLGDLFRFTYIRNPQAAFGVGVGGKPFHILLSTFAILFLLLMLVKIASRKGPVAIALALILGGAVGNLIDRIRTGEVIDFLDLGIGRYRWPVFNFADVGVTVGVIFLVFSLLIPRRLSG